MGKITDALKKLQQERQIHNQDERNAPIQSQPEKLNKAPHEILLEPQQRQMAHPI